MNPNDDKDRSILNAEQIGTAKQLLKTHGEDIESKFNDIYTQLDAIISGKWILGNSRPLSEIVDQMKQCATDVSKIARDYANVLGSAETHAQEIQAEFERRWTNIANEGAAIYAGISSN